MMSVLRYWSATFILFITLNQIIFAQARVNELSTGLAFGWSPGWEFKNFLWGAGGHYTRTLNQSFALSFAYEYVYGYHTEDVDWTDPANFGKMINRSLHHTDITFNYQVLKNNASTFSISPYVGLSYVWGYEPIFIVYYPSPPASFPEAWFANRSRNEIGLVTGVNFNFIFFQKFNIQPRVKLRAYTKGVSEFSYGLNLGFRFADPRFSKK